MFPANYVTVSQNELEGVINALRMPDRDRSAPSRHPPELDKIIKHGCCDEDQLENVLIFMNPRIDHAHFDPFDDLAKHLELDKRDAFQQNSHPDEGPVGYTMISAATVACVMIWFERLGFNVNPAFICGKLVAAISPEKFVTQEEITVLRYAAKRYATAPVTLQSKNRRFPHGQRTEFDVGAGYRDVVENDDAGVPVSLEVHAPNYTEPKPHTGVKCDMCLMNYVSGIPSDEHQHNIEHRKVVTTLKPVPSRALRRAVSEDPEAVWFTQNSPNWMDIAIFRRAKAFKREFKTDFIQWKTGDEFDATGFLFHDDDFRIVGACCFRPASNEQPNVTRLDWIWICPEMRRAGVLSKQWDRFRKRFGEFQIEPPVSRAMQSFLQKRGDEHLIR